MNVRPDSFTHAMTGNGDDDREWSVTLTVRVSGVASQRALDAVVDRINETGYVTDIVAVPPGQPRVQCASGLLESR